MSSIPGASVEATMSTWVVSDRGRRRVSVDLRVVERNGECAEESVRGCDADDRQKDRADRKNVDGANAKRLAAVMAAEFAV